MQAAFDALIGVETDLTAVRAALNDKLASPHCRGTDRANVVSALANAERTYLIRLLAEFEGQLGSIGSILSRPVAFTARAGLYAKLNGIAASCHIPGTILADCQIRLREHRNDLAHGRSLVVRVSFADSHSLMKTFLRLCH